LQLDVVGEPRQQVFDGVTGAMAVTSERVTPNPAASMTGVQFGWWFRPSAAAAAWQRCSSRAARGWLRKRGRAASSATTRTPPGASWHAGQVQDGCEVIAEHLGIEVEDAVLVMASREVVGVVVVVPRPVRW